MTARQRTSRLRMRAFMIAIPAAVGLVAGLMMWHPSGAYAQSAPVGLGTAADFSVLAGSTVTNTGDTFLEQNLGVHPGSTAPGFPPGEVGGAIHLADAVAEQAKLDLTTAYNDAAGRTPFVSLPAELGGSTLTPGIYRIAAAQLTGQLTLDLQENPEAVFIFQIDSTLITASNSSVIFINGSSPCNVYWQVGSSATLGTGSDFIGNIMASTAITMNTGATLEGRALAQTAAVTLDDNTITEPECAPDVPPSPTTDAPTDGPTTDGPPTDGPTGGPTTNGPGGPTSGGPSNGGPGDGNGSDGNGSDGNGSDSGFKPGAGLAATGGGAWPVIVTAGLALAAVGGLFVLLAWRRARLES
ncbi:ice-binding family protein [Glycomyces sp. NRRL B-16210]|uniref:ice-binding family protein n=1 Tax=Glycomyces sp. NRRL B-16210 TaxID=1463821 RepID=UPI0004C193EC|nr:ice-binding family protein [Glycomyces sp. NRRL B-16210]